MSYTDTFRVSYDDDNEMITIWIKQSDLMVLQTNMTFTAWEMFLDEHRDAKTKYVSMAVPISDRAVQHIRVPARDFRLLVAEYDLKMNEAGN